MARKSLIWTMLVMLLLPLAGAGAQSADQDADFDYCAILAEPDCQILADSDAAMAEVSSVAFDASMSLHLLSDVEEESADIQMTGSGKAAVDLSTLTALNDLSIREAVMDMEQTIAMLADLLGSAAAEISLRLTITSAGETFEMPLNLVVKNEVLAIDLASLAEATAESFGEDADDVEGMEGFGGWLGFSLADIIDAMLEDIDDVSMTESEAGEMIEMDEGQLAESITITRLPDEELNGAATAVFDIEIAAGAWPDIVDMATADMVSEAERAEMDAMMESFGDAPMLIRQYVGLDDLYVHRLDVFMDVQVPTEGTPMSLMSLTLSIGLSDFNVPVEIELPEDTVILPYAMLEQMGQMGQMGGKS